MDGNRLIGGSGGYFKLDSWTLANIVQLGTLKFCERFLDLKNDPCGRLYDQMTQAARSGVANIAEGSARHHTSTETEMSLTDVARASLQELSGDYLNWLLRHDQVPWLKNSEEAQLIYTIRLSPCAYSNDIQHDACARILADKKKFEPWLESNNSLIVANALLVLIARTCNMLNRQLQSQENDFRTTGGFRENLTKARLEARKLQNMAEGAPTCPICGATMLKIVAKRGRNCGHEFWGCTKYPDCKGTRDVS